MGTSRVFLSYRREDASGYVGRLHDDLSEHFGAEQVFLDTQDLSAGLAFPKALQEALDDAAVVLPVVGRDWAVRPTGESFLDDPTNWVRRELERALERGARIVPVLVHGASLASVRLPDSLASVAELGAVTLSDAGWRQDVQRLILTLEGLGVAPASLQAFPGEPEGGRVERRLAWRVPVPPEMAWRRVTDFAARSGFREEGRLAGEVRYASGSKWRALGQGSGVTAEGNLPLEVRIRIRETNTQTVIEALMRDSWPKLLPLTSTGRYRARLDVLFHELRSATGGVPDGLALGGS
jgi:hypothetical protein